VVAAQPVRCGAAPRGSRAMWIVCQRLLQPTERFRQRSLSSLGDIRHAVKSRFTSLAWIALAVGVGGCASTTLDYTTSAQSAICELHRRQMTATSVPLLTGTGLSRPTPEEAASERLFPHSDSPVRTPYCIPVRETHARIYVCPDCVAARRAWFATHKETP
jgi:hypothetical protein